MGKKHDKLVDVTDARKLQMLLDKLGIKVQYNRKPMFEIYEGDGSTPCVHCGQHRYGREKNSLAFMGRRDSQTLTTAFMVICTDLRSCMERREKADGYKAQQQDSQLRDALSKVQPPTELQVKRFKARQPGGD